MSVLSIVVGLGVCWLALLTLAVALCKAARRGDELAHPHRWEGSE